MAGLSTRGVQCEIHLDLILDSFVHLIASEDKSAERRTRKFSFLGDGDQRAFTLLSSLQSLFQCGFFRTQEARLSSVFGRCILQSLQMSFVVRGVLRPLVLRYIALGQVVLQSLR